MIIRQLLCIAIHVPLDTLARLRLSIRLCAATASTLVSAKLHVQTALLVITVLSLRQLSIKC